MKKILLAFLLVFALVLPLAGSALTRLEECKLGHDLGTRLCGDVNKLVKGMTITLGGTGACCDLPGTTGGICKDAGVVCLIDFVNTIGDWIFAGLLAIVVIILFFAGFQFITAGGSPEGVMAARSKIIYAIVGLAVAFLAKALIKVIEVLVG